MNLMNLMNLFLLSIVFLSCSSSGEQPSVPNAPLTNTRWVLKTLNDKAITIPQEGKDVFILFTNEENKANGSGGCNNFFTTYSVTGKNLKLGPVASTEMFCENRMDTESAFFKALENTVKYRIKGNTLYLSDSVKVIAKLEASSSK